MARPLADAPAAAPPAHPSPAPAPDARRCLGGRLAGLAPPLFGAAIATLLYLISRANYPLFHGIADMTSVFVAGSVFFVVWSGRRNLDNQYYLLIAIAFLAFAVLDFMHLIGNKGMGVFPQYGNLGPTFYIASRYLLGISFLLAPLFIKRKVPTVPMLAAYLLVAALVVLSVLYWRNFPATHVEGRGLTAFKVYSDYAACLMLLGGLGLLLLNRRAFDGRVLRLIVLSLVLSIGTGLAFTLYTDPFGIANAVGHVFQLASFYLIYLGVVQTVLTQPQAILYRNLQQSNDSVFELNAKLEEANANLGRDLAARKEAEEALRSSEETFGAAFHSNAAAMMITGLEDGRVLDVNEAWLSMTQRSREQIVGRTAIEHGAWQDLRERQAVMDELKRAGHVRSREIQCVRGDGRRLSVLFSAQLVTLRGEQFVVSSALDVTDRKAAGEALAASEFRYRTVAENTYDFEFWMGRQGRYLYASPSFRRIYGLDPDVLLSDPEARRRLVHPEDLPAFDAHAAEVRERQVPGEVEFRIVGPDGAVRWIHHVCQPVFNRQGEFMGSRGSERDVSDRHAAETASRENEERLRRLYAAMTDGLALHEIIYGSNGHAADYRVLDVNPAFESITGISRQRAVGAMASELYGTGSAPYLDVYARVAATGRPESFETDFSPMAKSFHISVFSTAQGRFATVFADITARKAAEEALRQSEEQFRVLTENLVSAVALINERGEISIVNESFRRLFDLAEDADLLNINSRDWSQWQVFDEAGRLLDVDEHPVRKAARTRTAVREVLVGMQCPGRTDRKWLLIGAEPILDAEGKLHRLICTYHDITARKTAEEALRLSEERFRLALKNSPVLVTMQDTDLVYQWAFNTRTRRPEEVVGKTDADLFAPDEAAAVTAAKRQVLETGTDVRRAFWLTSNGQRVFLDCYYEPLRDAAGKIIGVRGASVNLTEQKQAEDALRQSEERMRHIARAGRIGFVEWNATRDTGYWSPEHQEIYGWEPGSPLSWEDWRQGVHPDDRERVLANAARLLEQTRSQGQVRGHKDEYRFTRPDGSMVWIESDMSADMVGGEPIIRGSVRDITARKQAEDALRQSEERLRYVLNTITEGHYAFDAQWRFIHVNDYAAEHIFRKPREELIGRSPWEIWPSAKDTEFYPRFLEAVKTGREDHLEAYSPLLGLWVENHIYPRDGRVEVFARDVTERHKAQEALRDSERRLALAASGTRIGIFDWNVETGEATGTEQTITLIGLRPTTTTTTTTTTLSQHYTYGQWAAAVHPEDLPAVEAEIARCQAERKPFDSEYRVVRPDKSVHWLAARGVFEHDAQGRAARFLGILLDVTERRRSEEAVRELALRLNRAQEIAHVGSWELDLVANRLTWSDEVYRIFGLSPQEFGATYEAFLEHVHPDDRAAVEAAYSGSIRDNRDSYAIEHRVVRRGAGEVRWVQERCQHVRDASGRIVCSTGMVLDITDRKGAEAELARTTTELEMLLAAAPVGFCHLDRDLRFLRINERLAEMNGVPAADHLGKTVAEIVPTLWPAVQEVTARILATGQAVIGHEFSGQTPLQPGVTRSWSESWYPVKDAAGEITGFGVIVEDITERKRAEEALRQAKDELQRRVEERTGELKQTIDDLQEEATERVKAEEMLEATNRQLDERAGQLARLASELTLAEQRERRRLAKLLHDHLQQLLVGARLGLDVLGRRVAGTAHKKTIEDIRDLVAESIEASRSLTAELFPPILHEAGLPAALDWLARRMEETHGLYVTLDVDETAVVEQEHLNILLFEAGRELLFNVVKHAGVAEAELELAWLDERHLRLAVRDKGVGVANGARSGGSGTGFGLFSIRERLALLGGRLEITPGADGGTVAAVIAPAGRGEAVAAAPAAVAEAPAPAAPPPPAAPAHGPARLRILLADDHVVMRQGLSMLLKEEAGLEVVGEASDGMEAVELARRLKPDVILMDFSMPRLNGAEAVRVLHGEMPAVRIIGLSMYKDADRAAAMLRAGAAAYLSKSGDSRTLLDAVRGHCLWPA